MIKRIAILMAVVWTMSAQCISAQQLTLNDVIRIAQENSYDAQVAKLSFMSSYWTYRSFKADLKPSVNLSANLLGFDHSTVGVRDYETGQQAYVNENSMTNSMTLSLDQKIAETGGVISLKSYLYHLRQFDYNLNTINTQPLQVAYTQPLFAYNASKWEKKTAPLEYEIAQKNYSSAMQDVAITATVLFFNVLSAQSQLKQCLATVEDRELLLEMAKKRLALGTTTRSEMLQMELSLVNARVSQTSDKLALDNATHKLFSYLRVTQYEDAVLLSPQDIPEILLAPDDVLQKALQNSSHNGEMRLQELNAEKSLAQAKSARGLQMTLSGNVGLRQSASDFRGAYSNLQDNEVVGVTLSIPIFDWGVSKGRVKMAQAQLDVIKTKNEQAHLDYVQDLRRDVMDFNTLPMQCKNAARAEDIARERYEIMKKRFEAGTISVTDLNTAQQELESSKSQYISQLYNFWNKYYNLQKTTLYDWVNHHEIIYDYEKISAK